MKKALIWCVSISALFVLIASVFGVAKLYDMVNVYAFTFICIVYFGMILSTTGMLIYCGIKINKIIKQAIGDLQKLGVEIEKILNNLKQKLEKIPRFVWNIIFDILGIEKPKK